LQLGRRDVERQEKDRCCKCEAAGHERWTL
jgi:hypothetical protein